MMGFELIAEEKIREAIEQGRFERLSGMGRPLPAIDNDVAGDDRIGLHVLRQNGFLPEWLELRKQIASDRELPSAAMAEWERAIQLAGSATHPLALRAGERYRKVAAEVNTRIDLHNLRCPSIHLEIARFREDARPVER